MTRKDFRASLALGALVGLLAQPIISNFSDNLADSLGMSIGFLRIAVFLVFFVGAPAGLFVASQVARFFPVAHQFAKFVSVGALNSTIDLGLFNFETFLFVALPGPAVFAVFKGVSFLTATTNSFLWNKYWTFEAREKPRAGEVTKFYLIAISGGFLNTGIATVVRALGGSVISSENILVNIVAPLAGIFAVFLWNFLGYKYLVFKKG